MQYFGYLVLRFVGLFFWFVPFPVLYAFSNGLAFLFFRVFGYRRKVVISNLKRCFPEKGTKEIEEIALKSYRNLTDIILETLKSFSTPVKKISRRYKYLNPEVLNQYSDQGRSVILCGSHFNNWEWGVQTADSHLTGQSYGIYKPLKNKAINSFFNSIRERDGMRLLEMKKTFSYIKNNQKNPSVYIFIADQTPRKSSRIHWIDFMGNQTAAATGVDSLSRLYDYPVFHFEVHRVKRGYYEVTYTPICLNPSEKQEGEITQMFMNTLAKSVRQTPESWIWSHKRWKFTRTEAEKTPEHLRRIAKAKKEQIVSEQKKYN